MSDLSLILKEIIEGDFSLLSREELKNFDLQKIESAILFLLKNEKLTDQQKVYLAENSWKIFYKRKPPTVQEFLTEAWIGPMSNYIYPYIKRILIEFMDPTKPYRNLILYPFFGFGKTYLAMLTSLYIDTHISLMRDPKKFLGLNPASPISRVFLSFSLDKVAETLLEPYMLALEGSPIFEKVHTRESMAKREREQLHSNTVEKIFWTTASPTSAIMFANGTQIKLSSSLHKLLGLNLIGGAVTELTHFREAGKSDDYIMDLYQELKTRVHIRTTKNNYWGRVILDSSPNDISSPIDQYINGEAKEDPTNFIIKGAIWEWRESDFDMSKRFPVYKGSVGKPPKILYEDEVSNYDPSDIIFVPQELYTAFKDNPVKSLRDLAGIPSGNQLRLFTDYSKIEKMFDTDLKNIYTFIQASTKETPERLIWNKIAHDFFVEQTGKLRFYYKPWIYRTIHVDQSISGDTTGLAVCHLEKNPVTDEIVFVIDLTLAIVPLGGRISLDSIKFFIEDLIFLGNLKVAKVSFDTFQSESSIQYLESKGIPVTRISVDKSPDPYYLLYSLIEGERIKVGKNILLKNNLKSLKVVTRPNGTTKIDHEVGNTPNPKGDIKWETSLIGYYAKDVSDSVCGAVYSANTHLLPYGVTDIWENTIEKVTKESAEQKLQKFLKENNLFIVG